MSLFLAHCLVESRFMSDIVRWEKFEKFIFEFNLGYYCPYYIRWPFGYWLVGSPEDESLLWCGDADAGAETIAGTLQDNAQKLGIKNYGIYLSPSWHGDVKTLQSDLQALGWRNTFSVCWLVQNIQDKQLPEAEDDDGFTIETMSLKDLPDRAAHIAVFNTLHGGHEGEYTLSADAMNGVVTRKISVLRDAKNDAIIGMGFVGLSHDTAYLYGLGVLPEYRGRGLAKRLVTECMKVARSQNIDHAYTAVIDKNAASMKVQERMGYRVFAKTSAWSPKGIGSDLYNVDKSLQQKN